jgi:hypothetical protein
VKRWNLGFWQTVWRHGVWPSKFWIALGALLAELFVINTFVLVIPFLAFVDAFAGTGVPSISILDATVVPLSPLELAVVFLGADYLFTLLVAAAERRPQLLLLGLAFPLLRFVDSALFMIAFSSSFSARSTGQWASPARLGLSSADRTVQTANPGGRNAELPAGPARLG